MSETDTYGLFIELFIVWCRKEPMESHLFLCVVSLVDGDTKAPGNQSPLAQYRHVN